MRRCAVALVAVLGAACSGTVGREAAPTRLGAWASAFAGRPGVVWGEVDGPHLALPRQGTGIVLVDDDWPVPETSWPAEQRQALAQFVQDGGRLVLFGHAAGLAAELGIEPEPPERTVFRWGFDARATAGCAQLGVQVVSGRCAELFEGLPPGAAGEDVFFLAGDAPCTAPLCTWSVGLPKRGEVLARLAVQRDGRIDAPGAPVVVHWTAGKGAVLACGLLPRLEHPDEAVRAPASAFVRHCAEWAAGRGPLLVLAAAARSTPAVGAKLPRMAPLVPHWGWQLPRQVDGLERSADDLLAEALQPSWVAGADLCEIGLAGADGAVPLDWRSGDPLRPAPSFEGKLDAGPWQGASFRSLAAEAHGRGMLAFGSLDPLPVGDRAVERLVTLRFLARELACVRRFGQGALDGFGVREWLPDAAGYSATMLQDFQPAALLYRQGELAPPVAGALRALDGRDGAVDGLPFAGLSASWRAGFPAREFPLGILDARARPGETGCGSSADWIVTQANDFVRARVGLGAAMWWRRHDAAAFDRDTVDYVHGVSLEPLRAAVAMPLAATGSDGLRAAGAALLPGVPAGFGAHVDAPAGVHVLQNNWFRLLGSGGALDYDPTGMADFGPGALRLSPAFLRTRLFGGRPDGNAVRSERTDLLAAGPRGEGGYGDVARVTCLPDAVAAVPAVLERGTAPKWPASVLFDWVADVGYHELEVTPRTVSGRGVLTVSLDGVLLRAVPFGETRGEAVTVPLHVARGGPRNLELAVLDTGAVALDRLVVRRVGDVGVEAQVLAPAGSLASLLECSQSSYHAERIEFRTVADLPGFVMTVRCDRAVRNLQAERSFAWPAHRELAAMSAGDEPATLRQPFVLRSADRRQPDLVVAPLLRSRYEFLQWRAGELTWRSAPESGAQSRLGVLCCAHGEGGRWLPYASTVLGAVVDPLSLLPGRGGEATVASELPLPWTRVLRLAGDAATPFLVREQGLWYCRGSQPATDGGRWLRILHTPGDVVAVVGGPAVLARTRPGPGSLHLLALRDPEPASVTACVLQPSALVTPCVTMARDFASVELDGASWAHFDGRTVFLPNRAGSYRIVTKERGGAASPHVRATRAPLTACSYHPAQRELVLATPGAAGRPAELPWTAVLGGPVPTSIDGGEIVDDRTLRYPDAAAAAAARDGGVLIRFRNGTCRVRYGE